MATSYLIGTLCLALVCSISIRFTSAPLLAFYRQARYVWGDLIVPAIAAAFPIERGFPSWRVRPSGDSFGHVQRSRVIAFQTQRERRIVHRRQIACSGSIGAGLIAA